MIEGFFDLFIRFLGPVVNEYGLVAVFILMFINGSLSCPPSEVVLPLAGVLGASTEHSIVAVVIVALAGNMAGAYTLYFIGVRFGYEWVVNTRSHIARSGISVIRMCRFVLPDESFLHACLRQFSQTGYKWVFVFRCLPTIRSIISLPAGMAKMSLPRFSLYSAGGMLIWILIWTGLGYFASDTWTKYKSTASGIGLALLLAVVAFLIWRVKHRIRKWGRLQIAEQSPPAYPEGHADAPSGSAEA